MTTATPKTRAITYGSDANPRCTDCGERAGVEDGAGPDRDEVGHLTAEWLCAACWDARYPDDRDAGQ